MPLYDLLCLSRPQLQYGEMFQLIKRSCNTVLGSNGVLVKVTNNSETVLAYTIKKTHGHYPTANIWQLRFHAAPSVLKDMHLDLATDENVLRHQITRSPDLPRIKQWRVLHHYGKKVDLEGLTKAELYYRETGRKLFRGVGADECRYCGQHGHKGDTCPNVSAEEQARMDQTESYAVSQSALSGQSLTQHKASGDAGDAEGPDDAARHEDADEADFERMVEDLDDGKTKQSNGQVEEAAQHADADEAELAAATAAPADDAGGGTGSSGAR